MKVIIDIPNYEFNKDVEDKFQDYFSRVKADIDNQGLCGKYECETTEMFLASFKHAQYVPDNATNGDIFKVMFPNVKIIINENLGEQGTVFVIFENPETVILFDLDWWNAPYKKSEG